MNVAMKVSKEDLVKLPPETLRAVHGKIRPKFGTVCQVGDIPNRFGTVNLGKNPTWGNVHPDVLNALSEIGRPVVVSG